MSVAVTVLGTVRRAERTLLGHVSCELDAGSTRYDVLADPHPLLAGGRRIQAVLRPLRCAPDTPPRWHLLWCRVERTPSDEGPDNGTSGGTRPKD